ncbi:hypothetical protein CTEN210_01155 [Chaetoceros tenuissimus]|uniref:RCC1-like domain-containing protein n=1 Tax=Chaetoceros tenuissimus TaxID=426638 RepID=A0AAD3CF57_9STRA|nr:hypothetical protein CTEN210_01155 [Chaetoceros tenuissimus]
MNQHHGKSYAGGDHTLHITFNGRVKSAGVCGLGWSGMHDHIYPSHFRFRQVYLPDSNIKQVYASYCHNLALGESGTLYSWGCGNFDYVNWSLKVYENAESGIIPALGQGKRVYYDVGDNPKVVNLPLKKDKNGDREQIVDISGGVLHSAVLLNTGRVLTFGQNVYGELGRSSWRDHEPKEAYIPSINGKKERKIVKLGPGYHNIFAISSDGKLFCAGDNESKQCGEGPEILKSFSHVEELDQDEIVDQVEGGFCHTLVKTTSGKVYTLGCQSYGVRGVSLAENRTLPIVTTKGIIFSKDEKLPVVTQVELPTEAMQIAAGKFHNVILGKDGNVYTFGLNYCGQCSGKESTTDLYVGQNVTLGKESNDSDLYFPVPQKVKLPENAGKIVNVSAGFNHTILDDDTGKTFYAFGDNRMGQLGFGGDGYYVCDPVTVKRE